MREGEKKQSGRSARDESKKLKRRRLKVRGPASLGRDAFNGI